MAEVDARRLHLLGAPSLFEYCLTELGFRESEAWYRICAARAGRKFPVVFELLEKRELHLTTIAVLSKYLTHENHRELLSQARGKTKQQLLERHLGQAGARKTRRAEEMRKGKARRFGQTGERKAHSGEMASPPPPGPAELDVQDSSQERQARRELDVDDRARGRAASKPPRKRRRVRQEVRR